jgi:nucleotidyltransferase AbiEii toxin of type IV toxin-antitoxin system
MLTQAQVQRYSMESGIRDIMIAEKEVVLTFLLQLLSERGILDRLAFKGGTCLRKMFIGSQGRFSTDLDFTGIEFRGSSSPHVCVVPDMPLPAVAEADVDQSLQLLLHLRKGRTHVAKIGPGFTYAHPIDDPRRISVFDAALAFALASLAASAGNVEGKASRLVAALARFRQHRVEIAYLREYSGIGRRIRARRRAHLSIQRAILLRPYMQFRTHLPADTSTSLGPEVCHPPAT